MKQRGLLIFCLLVLIAASAFIPWKSSLKAPCYILAQKEWTLRQIEQDKLVARLENNQTGQLEAQQFIYIDRSDIMNLALDKSILPGMTLQAGQDIARMGSYKDSLSLNNLLGDLRQAEYQLTAISSGEKVAVRHEAEQALNYAKADLNAFLPQLTRKKELYAKNLIGQEELELAQAEYNLKKINVSIYKAQLENVQTGEKESLREVTKAQIGQLNDQIRLLKDKLGHYRICCPIPGCVCHPTTEDFLCAVQKQDTMLVRIAIPCNKEAYLHDNPHVNVWIEGITPDLYRAEMIYSGSSPYSEQGLPVFWVTGIIHNPSPFLRQGLVGIARIKGPNQTVFQRIAASWHKFRVSR